MKNTKKGGNKSKIDFAANFLICISNEDVFGSIVVRC